MKEVYRPSDANKWEDRRHRQLTLAEKVVYDYWWDRADVAGFYKISDRDMDCLKMGMPLEMYQQSAKSLCAPKEDSDGETHRGWIMVNKTAWCSHFIKHTQNRFGETPDNRHKNILEILCDKFHEFKNEPEFIEVLDSVQDFVWERFKGLKNPLITEKLNRTSHLPLATIQEKKKSIPMNFADQVMELWNEITGFSDFLNQYREKNIRERLSDGFKIEDFKRVFQFKYEEWKDKPEMAASLTIDTMIKPQHFQKYLEQSKRTKREDEVVTFTAQN